MMNTQHDSWYKEKASMIFSEIFSGFFSFSFIKAMLSSFAYFLHEQVIWRKNIHHKGDYRIHARASLRNAQNIYLGENVRITMDCCIWAEQHSKIIFGDNVLVGPGVKMFCGNHGTKLCDIPMVYQERCEKNIVIGNNVWIGANSVIVGKVKIGSNVLIAPNTYINFDVPDNSIVLGSPGNIIPKENAVEGYILNKV